MIDGSYSSCFVSGTPPPLEKGNRGIVQSLSPERPKKPWEVDYKNLIPLEKIGAGSFGEVWRADWKGTIVAVKNLFETTGINRGSFTVDKMENLMELRFVVDLWIVIITLHSALTEMLSNYWVFVTNHMRLLWIIYPKEV